MGQTATNFIKSTLEISEEYSDMDSRLLECRQALMKGVKNGEDINQHLMNLISLHCPVSLKYGVLNVKQILEFNNQSVEELKKIPVGLNILEKYGRHLLKASNVRAEMWRSVKYSNPIYKERVEPLKGSKDIMYQMGYTKQIDDGVYFPEGKQPDVNDTTNLLTDIIMARSEMELYLTGKHPRSADIEQYLPQHTVISVKILIQGGTMVNTERKPPETAISEPSSIQTCEICLNHIAEMYCQACNNKILCETCNLKWHQHPRRQEHKSKKLEAGSIPLPSRIEHQGAYGVTEIISRHEDRHRPPLFPKPVSSTVQVVKTPTLYNTSFPKFDTLVSQSIQDEDPLLQQIKLGVEANMQHSDNPVPPSINSDDINEYLQKYQMKIKGYSAQSTCYKPVNPFTNNKIAQTSMANSNSSALNMEMPDAVVRYPPSATYMSPTSGQSTASKPTVMMSATLPRTGISNISKSPPDANPVDDVESKGKEYSLSRKPKAFHSSLSRGVQPPQVTQSSTSFSQSKLLTKIKAIPNIDCRKSKCEINLIMLDNEMVDLDENLNHILTQDDQFLENEEFVTLTRKKSLLIRERKSIHHYLNSLEEGAEAKHYGESDHNNLSQIFYPPNTIEVTTLNRSSDLQSQTNVQSIAACVQPTAPHINPDLPPGVHLQRVNYQPQGLNSTTMNSSEIAWPPSRIPQNIPVTSLGQGAKPKVFVNKQLFPEEKVKNTVDTFSLHDAHIDEIKTVVPPATLKKPSSSYVASHKTQWACEHCTYENEAGTRVCIVCNKTSDSPKIIGHEEVERTIPLTRSRMNEEQAGVNMALPPLENVGNKLNELQDQVFFEKQEAHKRYQASLRQSSSSDTSFLLETSFLSGISDVSVFEQQVDQKSPTLAQVPQQIPPTNNSGNTHVNSRVTPPMSRVTSSVSRDTPPVSSLVDTSSSVDIASHKTSGTPNSDNFSNISDRSRNEHQGNHQGTFQQIMKQNNELREQKQIKYEGAELINMVKKAHKQGYDIEEIQVALEQSQNGGQGIIQWLQQNWLAVVGHVIAEATHEGSQLHKNTVGEISELEAKNALKKSKGNIELAVEHCVATRKKLYEELNGNDVIENKLVLDAMLQCQGDPEKVQEQLIQTTLQPFVTRIWEDTEGTVAHVFKSDLCNSISTSIIERESFQNVIKNTEIDKERRIRMVLIEAKLKSWGRAETVIKIVDQHLSKSELDTSTLEDVVEAVRNCGDYKSSMVYLQQGCEVCLSQFPRNKITSLNLCECKICLDCVKQHFDLCITEKNVRKWTCPVCSGPNMSNEDDAQNYLAFLKLLIINHCDKAIQDLFDQKANLWNIQQDPNFRWCAHCVFGFIFHGGINRLCMTCENCRKKTCFSCKKEWETQHEGITCEEFEQWKLDNDPNNQAIGLAKHLEVNGIECPSCKMRFALSKGGCMHFTCPQCSHEFCSGCCQPFFHETTCPKKCGRGLHCHHPRDCFFFLRDEEPQKLQELLEMHKKKFNKNILNSPATCPVMEQKEGETSIYDEACGKEVEIGLAGLCLNHYKEYLVDLINKHSLDPLDVIKEEDALKIICGRLTIQFNRKESENRGVFLKRIKRQISQVEPLQRNTGQRPASVYI